MFNAGIDLLGLSQNISGIKYHNAAGDVPQPIVGLVEGVYGVWPFRQFKVGIKTLNPHGLNDNDTVVINITNGNSADTKTKLTGTFTVFCYDDSDLAGIHHRDPNIFYLPAIEWVSGMAAIGTWQLASMGCLNGYHKDSSGACVADSTLQQCSDAGKILNNGACESCPTNYHPENNVCKINTVVCPTGQHEVGGVCVANTLTCPTGQVKDSLGNCVAGAGPILPTWTIYVGLVVIAGIVGWTIYRSKFKGEHHINVPVNNS